MVKQIVTLTGVLLFGVASSAMALKTDRDQPAVIDADEVEMDFNTGVRTYRGNVYVQQGTIRIKADEIVVYLNDGKLERATAVGRPAIFRQRPDGKEHDVIGKGRRMELDEINNIVTLMDNASVQQAQDTVTGAIMVYDMEASKLKVDAGKGKKQPEQTTASGDTESASGDASASSEESSSPGRVKLTIQPRNKEAE